ncbi:uncharacterized protein cubi_00469 [Cryptosporidium ubiquitum]|uniref:Uncharacterized protein n=1 Tax=Cryptosporidium ubiquitum TaxID=857276 RepID=A0A1J4ME07_9CRYT|nr:uncharacterized protein cubi_00469 [Cryptosporidium ubiquitum]OII72474.1 hypothetical protein cubi_00469 [Cryptosporidium ubiquitum]
MRHQRRLSHPKKGEREQFKHHLLPYPGKPSKATYGKKCENYPEFLFCIPIKPASNILGCELDIFVKLVSIISICIWLSLLVLEGFYFYIEIVGAQTVFFVTIAIIFGLLLVSFGIFCGILGYIGCTISNFRCIYFFFLHLNYQLIVNVYAVIASVIRGYIIYFCAYLLSILLICFFLYPSWSLYVHIKINGIPPNVYKHYGLLNDALSKFEQKNERKSNLEESESFVENVCSSVSNGPGITTSIHVNTHIFQKKEQNRITMIKQQSSIKTSGTSIHNNNFEDCTDRLMHTAVKFSDENDNSLCTRVEKSTVQTQNTQTLDSSHPSSNNNSLTQPYIPPNISCKIRNEAKILLNWSTPALSINRNVVASSNAEHSNRSSDTTFQSNKLKTSRHNEQPKFTRTDI